MATNCVSNNYTPFWKLNLPYVNCDDWGIKINENFQKIDILLWNLYGFNLLFCSPSEDYEYDSSLDSITLPLSHTFREEDENLIQSMSRFGNARIGLFANQDYHIGSLTLDGTALCLFGVNSSGSLLDEGDLTDIPNVFIDNLKIVNGGVLLLKNVGLICSNPVLVQKSSSLFFLDTAVLTGKSTQSNSALHLQDFSNFIVLGKYNSINCEDGNLSDNPGDPCPGGSVITLDRSFMEIKSYANFTLNRLTTPPNASLLTDNHVYPYSDIKLVNSSVFVNNGSLGILGYGKCLFDASFYSTVFINGLIQISQPKDLVGITDSSFVIGNYACYDSSDILAYAAVNYQPVYGLNGYSIYSRRSRLRISSTNVLNAGGSLVKSEGSVVTLTYIDADNTCVIDAECSALALAFLKNINVNLYESRCVLPSAEQSCITTNRNSFITLLGSGNNG